MNRTRMFSLGYAALTAAMAQVLTAVPQEEGTVGPRGEPRTPPGGKALPSAREPDPEMVAAPAAKRARRAAKRAGRPA
jgi:hypothetical protein